MKNKVGRPRKEVKDKKIRTVYITDLVYMFFEDLGEGNFSKGIVIAHDQLSQVNNTNKKIKSLKK